MKDWKEENDRLTKKFEFDNFLHVMTFMTECSYHIEKMNHHPEWTNVYNIVDVTLTTHDAGNTVTEKDRKLAQKMDEIYARYV